jgi:hypothetical protein
MTRGIGLGVAVALLAASLARPAPVPPVKGGPATPEQQLALDVWLPPLGLFDARKDKVKAPEVGKTDLRTYAVPEKADKKTAEALRQAQLLLWATSPAPPPKALAKEVEKLRKEMKQTPSPLRSRVASGQPLGRQLQNSALQIARAISKLEAALEDLRAAGEPQAPRVKAQLTYLTAGLTARIIYLDEHQGALGQLRKEEPPLGPGHRAWQLRSVARLSDSQSRKLNKTAMQLYQQLIKDNPGTVWEALARQALKVPLGVEWVSAP